MTKKPSISFHFPSFDIGIYENWIRVCISLDVIRDALKDVHAKIVKEIHSKLLGDVNQKGYFVDCKRSCSRKQDLSRWCKRCEVWRGRIIRLVDPKRRYSVKWYYSDSNLWLNNPNEVAKILGFGARRNSDIMQILNLLRWCNVCKERLHTSNLKKVIDIRNQLFHETKKISRQTSTSTFMSSRKLLLSRKRIRAVTVTYILLILSLCLLMTCLWKYYNIKCDRDCFWVSYSFPRPRVSYLDSTCLGFKTQANENTIRCLTEEIDRQESRGVLLVGERMCGKTALTCNIACSNPLDAAYVVRQNIVLYHICSVQKQNTTDPVMFIMDVIGMLSKNMIGYEEYFRKNEDAEKFLNPKICRASIDECFHETVMSVVKVLANKKTPKLVVLIDAIDECEKGNIHRGKSSILQLIRDNIDDFPMSMKFIVTTRPFLHIQTQLSSLKRIEICPTEDQQALMPHMVQGKWQSKLTVSYHKDFNYVFEGKDELLKCAKRLLSVLAVLRDPLEVHIVSRVSKLGSCTEEYQLKILLKELYYIGILRMSNIHSNSVVMLRADAVRWLTDSNILLPQFIINRELGHRLLASFHMLNFNILTYFELEYHVQNSLDSHLIAKFKKYKDDESSNALEISTGLNRRYSVFRQQCKISDIQIFKELDAQKILIKVLNHLSHVMRDLVLLNLLQSLLSFMLCFV